MTKHHVAVLASGKGSNLQALIDAVRAGELPIEIVSVISDRPGAEALERARAAGIPGRLVLLSDRRNPDIRRAFEVELLETLARLDLDLIVLAGWMLILSADFLTRVGCPLLNLHPALLAPEGDIPILRGAHAVRDALALSLPFTGVSIHYVTPEVDAGPVVLSEVVPIIPGECEESLYDRIKTVEHRLLPRAVGAVLGTLPVGGVHA